MTNRFLSEFPLVMCSFVRKIQMIQEDSILSQLLRQSKSTENIHHGRAEDVEYQICRLLYENALKYRKIWIMEELEWKLWLQLKEPLRQLGHFYNDTWLKQWMKLVTYF